MKYRISIEEELPTLSPGLGFHLQQDGTWKVEKIPDQVLKTAEFSGYLTVEGYKSTIFDTPDEDSWAQKSTEVPGHTEASSGPDDLSNRIRRLADVIDNSNNPSMKSVIMSLEAIIEQLAVV